MAAIIKQNYRQTETQDATQIGPHYTGRKGSQKYRYGFIMIKDPANPVFDEQVVLNLAPESITEDEPAATNIVPTQNSGKWVERYGQILKTITITGTTGFNYNPKLPRLARLAMSPDFIAKIEGPDSGLGKFIKLRNIFRRYWEIFSAEDSPNNVKTKALFIFVNEKDDETWIVEPMNFRMIRQSPRNKFTYNYEITMQTIARLENVKFMPDKLTLGEKIKSVVQAAQTYYNQIESIANNVAIALTTLTGAVKETVATVLKTLQVTTLALQDVANGVKSLVDLPKEVVAMTSSQVYAVFVAAENIVTATGVPAVSLALHDALLAAMRVTANLAARNEMFQKDFSSSWQKATEKYNTTYGVDTLDESLTDPLTKNAVIESTVLPNDTLQKIAVRELGDVARFQELVVLNNLKPPYLSPSLQERLPNTLAPGDKILLPVASNAAQSKVPVVTTTIFAPPTITIRCVGSATRTATLYVGDNPFRENQWQGFNAKIVDGPGTGDEYLIVSNSDQAITVERDWDIAPAITSVIYIYLPTASISIKKSSINQAWGVDYKVLNGDFVASSNGDIMTVDGIDNMKQAIDAKLKTKPGELPGHPAFGLDYGLGQKATPDTLMGYTVAVKQTLLSDSRVERLDQIQVVADGDKLRYEGYVILSGNAQPLALDDRGVF